MLRRVGRIGRVAYVSVVRAVAAAAPPLVAVWLLTQLGDSIATESGERLTVE